VTPFGVYVHIPFCSRRCEYCAFATWTDRAALMEPYAAACRAEVVGGDLPVASSVFFGGGTPSLLDPALLAGILEVVPRADGAEVTVECNPESVTASGLALYRAAGVTRISLGVQSMAPHVLAGLGRTHLPGAVVSAVAAIKAAGFGTWNADLIFGGAGETDGDWVATLSAVLELAPPHVSAYALTVEAGTPLAADPSRHPDDDVLAGRYAVASDLLAEAGLASYEISNWSRPGHECRHNLLYWQQGNYRGIGCAAHSHRDGRRWWNLRTPERYIAAVSAGMSVEAGAEVLDDEARRVEGLRLAVRTREGVPPSAFDPADLELLTDAGLLEPGGRGVLLTVRGRMLANEVAIRLGGPAPAPAGGSAPVGSARDGSAPVGSASGKATTAG
jgi:putative oxygen-independent coproporphyrinogen III oxidase